MGSVIYCQNDRNKMGNHISMHLCGLLLLLVFSLGLAMYLLRSPNIGYEEMAIVKAIPNSPGNF